jgi:hypothetical protein
MSLADLRDLFIVIFALAGIGATLFFSIISFLIFRRVRSMLQSGQETLGNVRDISTLISDNIVRPLASIAGIVEGLRRGLEYISGLRRRKEGSNSERGE